MNEKGKKKQKESNIYDENLLEEKIKEVINKDISQIIQNWILFIKYIF